MLDRRQFFEYFGAAGLAGTGFDEALWVSTQEDPASPVTTAMINERIPAREQALTEAGAPWIPGQPVPALR